MSKKYIIGTRGSLLALTQCGQIKDELEKLTGDKFELKVIKTQGDQVTDKALWQLEGKDFFTKELDEQLLLGDIDMVVHSYKDLGSERPEGIKLAAITQRKFGHDIFLIKKSTKENLFEMKNFVVGTSSPRRITNIEKHLKDFIPNGENLNISTKVLRGNVNTRIGKLLNDEYDAIVLALPGIERLAMTESSKKELIPLIKDLDFMILPHSIFPAAASQGALGIECLENRNDNGELLEKLQKLNDKLTISEVSRERQAFKAYGGGCHLAVGINVTKVHDYYVHHHMGKVDDKQIREAHLEGSFIDTHKKSKAFLGLPPSKLHDDNFTACHLLKKTPLKLSSINAQELLVASSYGIDDINFHGKIVYSAGVQTWKQLTKKGQWVHASCDGLGEAHLESFRSSALFNILVPVKDLAVLTHANSSSKLGKVQAVYQKEEMDLTSEQENELLSCDVFYWTSFTQFQSYIARYPQIKDGLHCSGLGKSFDSFRAHNIAVRPFLSIEDFKKWFKS